MALPGQKTLAEIRLLAKQRADMEDSEFVDDPEWLAYINGSYAWLYNLLVEKYGEDYESPEFYEFTADGSAEIFPLPDGSATYQYNGNTCPALLKLQGVDAQVASSPADWSELKKFTMAERNRVGLAGARTSRPRYRQTKSGLWLRPLPAVGQKFRVIYVPRFTPLAQDSDVLDGISGWEELVVVDAARKALVKEESDVAELKEEIRVLVSRIEHEAENRDQGSPATVADVRSDGYCSPDDEFMP